VCISGYSVAKISGVQTGPGATVFTRSTHNQGALLRLPRRHSDGEQA
jgi:hypothetical protein